MNKMMRMTRDRQLPEVHGRLWRAVQEKLKVTRKKQKLELMGGSRLGYLPWDLIYKIFFLLPDEYLYIATLVCKGWKSLIESSDFTEAHSRKSDTVLVFLKTVRGRRPRTQSVGPFLKNLWSTHCSFTYIHFLEINGKGKETESTMCGLSKILATCNGLVLGRCELGLAVVNPATKKAMTFPLGTCLKYGETYSLVFSQSTQDYKVVHVFNNKDAYTSCEMFSLSKRSWWAVDGPTPGIGRLNDKPIEVFQSLHWLPRKHSTHTVSMSVEDERFFTINLPTVSEPWDALVEIRGCLAFLSRKAMDKIDVWMLSALEGKDWEKQHVIVTCELLEDIYAPVCIFCFGKELVFRGRSWSSFYCYDLETEKMRMVEIEIESAKGTYVDGCTVLPHLNTLASWDRRDQPR